MAQTRTSGISVDAVGNRIINKQVSGKTIFRRLGRVSQEAAEAILSTAAERARIERSSGSRPRVTFREAAVKYLELKAKKDSIETIAFHVQLLDSWIGDKSLEDIWDEPLGPFKAYRLNIDGVSVTTVNRSLEVIRTILNLAASSWRHPNGMTWLERPPILAMASDEGVREPYPLSWDEQRFLFSSLPAVPNGEMALFKVNTGTREQEVCRLRWDWEVEVPELNTSVFIVPKRLVKNDEHRVIVLNQVAKWVIEGRRGFNHEYVFTFRDWNKPLGCMNNTAWQNARVEAAIKYQNHFGKEAPWGFRHVRVHDLKHTFGRRLRAVGVKDETRKVLLGHRNGDITTHYSAVELQELLDAVNKIDASVETPTITLLRAR